MAAEITVLAVRASVLLRFIVLTPRYIVSDIDPLSKALRLPLGQRGVPETESIRPAGPCSAVVVAYLSALRAVCLF